MLKRRCTEPRKVICHYDDALAMLPSEVRNEYCDKLDIELLGPLDKLEVQPTIFTVAPLKPEYEDDAYTYPQNFWSIFASHVKDVKNLGFELDRIDGIIDYKHRKDFPPEWVQNIASIIISLANRGNSDIFFTRPQGVEGYWAAVRVARRTEAMEKDASTVGAKIKQLKQADSK